MGPVRDGVPRPGQRSRHARPYLAVGCAMGVGVYSGPNPEALVPEQNASGQRGWHRARVAKHHVTEQAWPLGPQFIVSNSRFLSRSPDLCPGVAFLELSAQGWMPTRGGLAAPGSSHWAGSSQWVLGLRQGCGSQVALWCLRAKALDSGLPEFQSCPRCSDLGGVLTWLILGFRDYKVGIIISVSLGLCRINDLIAINLYQSQARTECPTHGGCRLSWLIPDPPLLDLGFAGLSSHLDKMVPITPAT